MPDLKITGLSLITIISLVMSGVLFINTPNIYYCESRDLAFQCDKLSSTGKTCYIGNISKICSDGWQKLNLTKLKEDNTIITSDNFISKNILIKDGRDWVCDGNNFDSICKFGSRIAKYGDLI